MKPHTVLQQSTPSVLVRKLNSDDPRELGYAIESLIPVIESGGGRAKYTVDTIKEGLSKPNARGVTPLGKIAESSVDKLGHNVSGTRRAHISAKRADVLVWAMQNGLEDVLFTPDGEGTRPFSRFVASTQAWNGNNPKAKLVMDAVSDWDQRREGLDEDLKTLGVSDKNRAKIDNLTRSVDVSM